MLIELNNFLDEVSSDKPAPGGGSVAFMILANTCALLAKLTRVVLKNEKDINKKVILLEKFKSRCLELVNEDSKVFNKCILSGAYKKSIELSYEKKEALEDNFRVCVEGLCTIAELYKKLEILQSHATPFIYMDLVFIARIFIASGEVFLENARYVSDRLRVPMQENECEINITITKLQELIKCLRQK